MNIQQYYQQSAAASLNASLAALIPSILLLIYAFFISQTYQLCLLAIPFLIYSFFCYQRFLLNQNRAKAVKFSTTSFVPSRTHLFESDLLITFMPAPSLRLLLFTPNGMKVGEIRDQSFFKLRWLIPNLIEKHMMKKYVLYDYNDEPIVYYRDLKDRIKIISPNNQEIADIFKGIRGKEKEFFLETRSLFIKNSSLQDYSFHSSDGTQLARIQTGWMPLEWGERFVQANTPILSMSEELSEREKIQLFALLISLYQYVDH